ncbi:MAG: KilA-N domain-containing protein, partial [Phormidesmis sp.]
RKQSLVALITITSGIEGQRGGGGTWAHPDIALQFAQWCSPVFALQVSRWVREWLTSGPSPLVDSDRVGLRSSLKDDSRLRMGDRVKVYLEQIQRYDDRKYRGQFFARVHDAINQAVTGETAQEMRVRLSKVLGRKVAQKELIRDYFPTLVLQRYISMCEASANFMIQEELHPLTAVERAAEIVLYAGYQPQAINFVEHIKFVRQRLTTGQGGFELPESR